MSVPIRVAAVVAVAAVLLAGCGSASHPRGGATSAPTSATARESCATPAPTQASRAPVATITVAGQVIHAAGIGDVAAAICATGVRMPDGRLLAVASHRVLNAHAFPAGIRVDGELALSTTRVRAGDVLTFVPAPDRVEATRVIIAPVYLDAAAATLYASYRAGTSREVVGAVSGEVADSMLRSAPVVGALRTPARFALTFDDGPNPWPTSAVLALLAAHHAPAVFCLLGADALAFPALARQEANGGYQLCDHTQTHPLDLPNLPAARIAAEIRTGYNSIVRADGGLAPRYFRAPGGNWSASIDTDARALRLALLHWTVDPRD